MTTITTRAGKGSQLSWSEVDGNFTNLNEAKLESENAGSTGQVLTKTSTGAEWQAASGGDLVDDITPQLGGSLDVNGQQIVSVSNGNIVIAPNGTGQTSIKNLKYNDYIHSLGTTSGTITPDVANGNVQTITLNGNLTFSAFANPVPGQSLTLIVNTAGAGRTLSSTIKFSGGDNVISTTDTTDIIRVFYDGTNYWGTITRDFKYILTWASWDGSLDGNDNNFSSPDTHSGFVPVTDSYGIYAYRAGADANHYGRILNRSGSTLTLGGSTYTTLGNFSGSGDGSGGVFVLTADKTAGYYAGDNNIVRLNSISSSGFTVSNMVSANTTEMINIRLRSNGVVQSFQNNSVTEITVTGTSTISVSQSTTSYSNLPSGSYTASVAPISDTQHIRIQINSSTGAVSAWLCTIGTTSATQIGTTITDGTSFSYMRPGGKFFYNDVTHGKALGFAFNGTTKQQNYYVATSTTFTKFTISANTLANSIVAGNLNPSGHISLDNDRFMIKHPGTSNEIFWIVDTTAQTTQSYFKTGNSWEETTRSSLRKWNDSSVFSGNWKTGRILRIS
jgi:hypothetical protein